MTHDIQQIRTLLAQVNDPELPVLSIIDLAIVRDVKVVDGCIEVSITPT